jgi:hypothetical protein
MTLKSKSSEWPSRFATSSAAADSWYKGSWDGCNRFANVAPLDPGRSGTEGDPVEDTGCAVFEPSYEYD